MKISLVMPNRNNLKYFKWAYESIRKNQGRHEVWICSASDACTDGTLEYYEELSKKDKFFKYIVNPGPERVGHTILYDRIINEIVETDIAMIYHCDMYLCPGALEAVEHLMYKKTSGIIGEWDTPFGDPKYKTLVSLTRIEPPLHPPGPEKIVADFGIEPEEFDECKFLKWYNTSQAEGEYVSNNENEFIRYNGYSEGIFAPWAFFVKDFKDVYGHDPLYKPQSKEDSDIFNKFSLNGCTFKQTWLGHVYHMTCRGSRFNPQLTTPGKNSQEWELQNMKSARNFIRKWGAYVAHDPYMKPIVKHKYDIGLVVKNCTLEFLYALEPWVSTLYVDCSIAEWIEDEQPRTLYDLCKRVKFIGHNEPDNDIVISCDGNQLIRFKGFQPINDFIFNLSDIITETNTIDKFEYDCFTIDIRKLDTYEHLNLLEENNIEGLR